MGTTLWEFIKPVGRQPTVWRNALDMRGPGLHHVAYSDVDPYDDVVDQLLAGGMHLSAAGVVGADRWSYVEGPGVVLELMSGGGPQLPPQE